MRDDSQRRQRLRNDLAAGKISEAAFKREMEQLSGSYPSVPAVPPPSSRTRATAAIGPGTTVSGRFQLEIQLGKGGMGEVWKAWEITGKRHIVIKILPRELQGNQTEIRRIEQMFHHVEKLQHQHICPVLAIDHDPASVGCYIVMKYIEGLTLRAYRQQVVARQQGFPWQEIGAILGPIASALDYAHSRRIVHRDVKSENIMVTHLGDDPQLVDFGLAAEIRNSHARVSQRKMDAAGTYPYMAPEQWQGAVQEGAADQYALGVVAFELLTGGSVPYYDADPERLRKMVLQSPVPDIPGLPVRANRTLQQALAKQPGQRFADCSTFIETLSVSLSQGGMTRPPAPPIPGHTPPGSTAVGQKSTTSPGKMPSTAPGLASSGPQSTVSTKPPRHSFRLLWHIWFRRLSSQGKLLARWLLDTTPGRITLAVAAVLFLIVLWLAIMPSRPSIDFNN